MRRSFHVYTAHRASLLRWYSSSVAPINVASSPALSPTSNPLALNGFQLYNRSSTNSTSQSLHIRSFAVPKGMCAVGVPSSSAMVEHIASQYAEAMTLADMSRFHQAVVKNAQQTQQFYEETLLKGFGGSGGGGVVSARPLAAGAPQPVAAASACSDAVADVPKQKPVAAKTSFNVQLAKFDPSIKIKLIKELRTVTNLPLGEAKSVIDKCPGLVASNMSKDDADRLKKAFEDLGATVELL
jgi:large subunit ribosomal protein L7/L12